MATTNPACDMRIDSTELSNRNCRRYDWIADLRDRGHQRRHRDRPGGVQGGNGDVSRTRLCQPRPTGAYLAPTEELVVYVRFAKVALNAQLGDYRALIMTHYPFERHISK